jgi:hypothetical protein
MPTNLQHHLYCLLSRKIVSAHETSNMSECTVFAVLREQVDSNSCSIGFAEDTQPLLL